MSPRLIIKLQRLRIVREAPELERVTWLGLQKLEQILRILTDRADGNLLRAQTAAAGLAVNAQVRADEAKLKQARSGDIMPRILMMLSKEEAKLKERMSGLNERGRKVWRA